MKPAVLRPAATSRSRCSMGRRTRAWVPVRKTRPESSVYLSSSVTSWNLAGAFIWDLLADEPIAAECGGNVVFDTWYRPGVRKYLAILCLGIGRLGVPN